MSTQRLVAFLALRLRPLRRNYVAGILWTESQEERATASLRSALWRLRLPDFPLIEASSQELALGSRVRVDYRHALELAHQVMDGHRDASGAGLSRLPLHLLMEDLLPDWYEDWVTAEREYFRQLRLHALEILCERFAEAGLFGRAVEAGVAAVQAEPLRESAHRALMRAFAAEGNSGEVVRQYRWYCRILWEELGGRPSGEMEELVRELHVGR
ncbi:MAG: transcriptional regulator [Actinomycetota bacterium]|nr:transcriptional regulator [Actinomycetota bacterium]